MPLYEYKCTTCENEFERLRSFGSSDRDICCPKCSSEVKRKLSVFAAMAKSNSSEPAMMGSGGGCAGCAAGSCATCH